MNIVSRSGAEFRCIRKTTAVVRDSRGKTQKPGLALEPGKSKTYTIFMGRQQRARMTPVLAAALAEAPQRPS